MSDELKACPFCGGSVETREDGTPRPVLGVLVCQGCTAEAEPQDWNRRTVTREQVEKIARHIYPGFSWTKARPGVQQSVRNHIHDMFRAAGFEVAE